MKISKLFHWLYAILMLLPVFFIAVRCGYVMFNKNAKDSYSGSITQTTAVSTMPTNTINSVNDFVVGNYYELNWNTELTDNNHPLLILEDTGINNFKIVNFKTTLPTYTINNFNSNLIDFLEIKLSVDTSPQNDILNADDTTDDDTFFITGYPSNNFTSTLILQFIDNTNFTLSISDVNIYFSSLRNEYQVYNIVTIDSTTLDNAFEYSLNQINETPLFAWAKDSFLVTPFSYITGLFGLSSSSPINTLLSYWLSISIIWLVFDLVMYLPLLVHRWLDKGVLE